jgi:hypothetical protein
VPPKALDRNVEVTMRSFDAAEGVAPPSSLIRQSEQRMGPVADRLAVGLGPIVSLFPMVWPLWRRPYLC